MNIIMAFVSIILGAVAQIALKLGANKSVEMENAGLIKSFINFPVITGIFLYGISALVWIVVLRKVELSTAYPMVSFGYVIVFIASFFLFGESLSLNKIIGLALIVAGILFISKS